MPFRSETDDRSCGNFWQRAKRRLSWARCSSHETTSIHLRAAALPGRRGGCRGRTFTIGVAQPDRETRTPAQTDRSGETAPRCFAVAFGKTLQAAQAKALTHGISLFIFGFLSFSLPEIFTDEKRAAVETRCRT
jgi:hypothetical protein